MVELRYRSRPSSQTWSQSIDLKEICKGYLKHTNTRAGFLNPVKQNKNILGSPGMTRSWESAEGKYIVAL
jgi:hypothetical protein